MQASTIYAQPLPSIMLAGQQVPKECMLSIVDCLTHLLCAVDKRFALQQPCKLATPHVPHLVHDIVALVPDRKHAGLCAHVPQVRAVEVLCQLHHCLHPQPCKCHKSWHFATACHLLTKLVSAACGVITTPTCMYMLKIAWWLDCPGSLLTKHPTAS